MEAYGAQAEPVRCSFCEKTAEQVNRLVAGPGVHICNECVGLANGVIEEYDNNPVEVRLPLWEAMTEEQMLEHIPRVSSVADQVEANLRAWVQELRRRGVTWARIGQALGVTRQSAWERFSGEE